MSIVAVSDTRPSSHLSVAKPFLALQGGSKAVVLVEPNEQAQFRNDREFVIRKSVKAFCDAMLDLNTTHQDIRDLIVDYYGKEELIYLGPDENIIPSDIVWIIKR